MRNHIGETLAIDFAVVPAATFSILYLFFVLSLERRPSLTRRANEHPKHPLLDLRCQARWVNHECAGKSG